MKIKQLLLVGIISFLSIPAFSGTTTATPKATASLIANCAVRTQDMVFGNIIPGASSSTASATMTVLCTRDTSYRMTLLFSQYGTDCTYMAGKTKGDRINYGTWYNSLGGTVLQNNNYLTLTGTGSEQNYTFYSQINPVVSYGSCKTKPTISGVNPYSIPDDYADTVTFSITY